jgi:hypothetical protein
MGRGIYPITSSLSTGSSDVKTLVTATTTSTYLDLSTASVFKVTISSPTNIYFSNAPAGTNVFSFTVITVNDATANRVVAFTGAGATTSIKWAGALIPPRTLTANGVDVWTFYTEDGGVTYVGSLAINDAR